MRVLARDDFEETYRRALWRQVLLVYASLECALWTAGPAQICFIVLTVALAAAWTLSPTRPRTDLGLGLHALGRGWWIAAIGAAVAGLVLLAGWRAHTLRPPPGSLVVGENVMLSLIWALMQQFLLQSFFFARLEYLLRSGGRAVIAAALLFASAHIPNPVLVPVTLAGGLILSEVFRRCRTLYPLAVAHALVALSLAISVPEPVLHDMRVGIGYIYYQAPPTRPKSVHRIRVGEGGYMAPGEKPMPRKPPPGVSSLYPCYDHSHHGSGTIEAESMAQSFDRRTLLKAGAAAAVAPYLWLPAHAAEPAWPTQTVGPFVEVEIDSGRIRGGHSRGALAFKGIPYAGSVSGANRFKEAPPVAPWAGVRDATRLGPPAMQGPGTTYGEHEPAYSENCLVLNVWTPAVKGNGRRPVMFYCHGGGFTTGSGGQNIQDGSHLAAAYDVVVVALNHRLGLLGYLYLGELGGSEYATSGNQGMLDIVAALRWVRRNIAVFGGDPGNVMVFGESGGGEKTSTLMAMPTAHGLLHKAGIQSGAMLRGTPRDVATETARRLLAGLGLTRREIGRLAEVPVQKLIAIQLAGDKHQGPLSVPTPGYLARHPNLPPGIAARRAKLPGGWGPVVDGTYLPRDPFAPDAPALAAAVPLLIGNTHDEAVFFHRNDPAYFHADAAEVAARVHHKLGNVADRVLAFYRRTLPDATPVEREIAIETATFMGNDTALLADRKSLQPAPVYRYRDDFRSNVTIKGTDWTLRACHASDIAIAFYNYEMRDLQGNGPGLAAVSRAMSGYFSSFARNGAPAAQDQPAWSRYDMRAPEVLLLNSRCRVARDPNGAESDFWRSLGWT